MVCRVSGWDERLLNLPDTAKSEILKQSEQFSELDLIRFYDLLNRTDNELRWHSHPAVHLEMTLMKLIELAQLPSLEEVVAKLESGKTLGKSSPQVSPAQSSKSEKPLETSSKGSQVEEEKGSQLGESPEAEKAKDVETPAENQGFAHLLSAVQMESIPLYSSLQHASQATFQDGKLSILFPQTESFHRQFVLKSDNQGRLSRLCAKIAGSVPKIEVRLDEPLQDRSDPTENPKVKAFIETFPGKVIVEKEAED
jgi:DNA polymerase III gamma/tau subunit